MGYSMRKILCLLVVSLFAAVLAPPGFPGNGAAFAAAPKESGRQKHGKPDEEDSQPKSRLRMSRHAYTRNRNRHTSRSAQSPVEDIQATTAPESYRSRQPDRTAGSARSRQPNNLDADLPTTRVRLPRDNAVAHIENIDVGTAYLTEPVRETRTFVMPSAIPPVPVAPADLSERLSCVADTPADTPYYAQPTLDGIFQPATPDAFSQHKTVDLSGAYAKRWLKNPVSFDVKEYSLTKLLREFASHQGVSCDISEKLTGTISGLSAFKDPETFLDLLGKAQNMNWYYDGTVVYFFPDSDLTSKIFLMNGVSEDTLRQSMIDLGLYDPRFSWKMTEDKSILMVQGPPPYLRHIDELMLRKSQMTNDKELVKRLGVFRLKHAWAGERSISSGDNQVTLPGVAAMLQQIVSGGSIKFFSSSPSPAIVTSKPRLVNKRLNEVYDNERQGTTDISQVGGLQQRDGDSGGDGKKESTPFIQADPRLNAVLVWDYERNMELHKAIIEQLDQPLSLVEIRAAIVDVDVTRASELGVSMEYLSNNGKWETDTGSNVGSGFADAAKRVTGEGLQISTIYTNGLDQFMTRISAIAKDGHANVLSRPSVLTQDNIEAIIQHTETFYVQLLGDRRVDLADIKTGLVLRVTPHIVKDADGTESIQLAVFISDGTTVSGTSGNEGAQDLPRVRESTISTQAVVYEGEALVIGGHYTETHRNNVSGVPGLSKIPGLGALFRTKSKNSATTERLFVLAPRIVNQGEMLMESGSEIERSMNYSPGKRLLGGPEVHGKKACDDYKKLSTW